MIGLKDTENYVKKAKRPSDASNIQLRPADQNAVQLELLTAKHDVKERADQLLL